MLFAIMFGHVGRICVAPMFGMSSHSCALVRVTINVLVAGMPSRDPLQLVDMTPVSAPHFASLDVNAFSNTVAMHVNRDNWRMF